MIKSLRALLLCGEKKSQLKDIVYRRGNKMKIAVGSLNPVKIDAVRRIVSRIFGEVAVEGVKVDSGVSHNPVTDAETIEGAVTRARAARKESGADLGVGLEGGITRIDGLYYTCVWCAVDNGREVFTGGGVHIPVPERVRAMIVEEQAEMGTVMDALTSIPGTKQKMGFEGIVTKGLINRGDSFENIISFTLAPLISPEIYG